MILSVLSVAVKTAVPVVVDLRRAATTPDPLEAPEAGEIVSLAPRLDASVTFLPASGVMAASNKVTVMVEVVVPSAGSVPSEAATVEFTSVVPDVTDLLYSTLSILTAPS